LTVFVQKTKLATLITVALTLLFPLWWMVAGSLTTMRGVIKTPPDFFPRPVYFGNYGKLFAASPVVRWFFNSLAVSASATALATTGCLAAGYALTARGLPVASAFMGLVVLTMALPGQVGLIPQFVLIQRLGLYDTLAGMSVIWCSWPYGIYLSKSFHEGMEREILEAARMDGANAWQEWTRVVLPLAKPLAAVLIIFSFESSWNSLMWHSVVAQSHDVYTLPVGIAMLVTRGLVGLESKVDVGLSLAAATFGAAPLVALFAVGQKWLVRGLSEGAIR